MTAANNAQVQVPVTPTTPVPVGESPLEKYIDGLIANGVTLELIVTLTMSNPLGIGAMDNVSDSIKGITDQSNVLSQVQSDIITLNAILSKIESQLGNGDGKAGTNGMVTKTMWGKFDTKLFNQFKTTYERLFSKNAKNPKGESDLALLKSFQDQYPSLKPAVDTVSDWETSNFQTAGTGDDKTFEQIIEDPHGLDTNWDDNGKKDTFVNAVCNLAYNHYQATHTSSGSQPSTDTLQTWWQSGNEGQSLTSEQSQEDSTQVQSYMQLLQGFDNAGQQMNQLASTQKSQMIQNEKTS